MVAFLMGPDERAALARIRALAEAAPVDMTTLATRLATPEGKAAHRDRMTRQSVTLPVDFIVTYSVEHGHPGGPARHLSVSVGRAGRLPAPEVIECLMAEMGFTGGLVAANAIWPEMLAQGRAVNVMQFIKPETIH